jgi:hypothetical protein
MPVMSLLTLATTIGESLVASAPSIVFPDARANTGTPSRRTVIETAAFLLASNSNAALVAGRSGFGRGSSVVVGAGRVVVVELVVLVVVVELVVVVVLVVVVARWVVVGSSEVLVKSVRGGSATGGAADEDSESVTPHPAAMSIKKVTTAVPREARVDRPIATR